MASLDVTPTAGRRPDLVEAEPARTLLEVFARTAARHGASVAIDAEDGLLTYSELSRNADLLAARLRDQGIGPGARVGVRLPSGTWQVYVALLGVLRAGAAYVPADPDDPLARAEAIWERAEVCAVLEDGLCPRPRTHPGSAGRMVVLGGPELPAGTSWGGAPVASA
jgi:non-ribosomal peptide synthetase component F